MFGLSYVKLGLIAAVVLAFALLAGRLMLVTAERNEARAQVAAERAEKEQAIAAADRNAQAVRDVTADRDQARKDATAVQDAYSKHRAAAYIQIAKLKKEVADATAENECPVAPSVLAVLRGLSDPGTAPDGDRGAGGKAADPGRTH